jgi:exosortase K
MLELINRRQSSGEGIQRWKWLNVRLVAQMTLVLLVAVTVKQFYSTTSVNELRWILAPTKTVVELLTGSRFVFESYSGYVNEDHTFIIAASCSGVNFLITAFLMLSLRRLWFERAAKSSWWFLPICAATAYATTIVANTVRISLALRMRELGLHSAWLDQNQLHRLEGILVYFGFLLLLFVMSERLNSRSQANFWRQLAFPLMIYYGITLGVPIITALRAGVAPVDFWEHLAFVALVPLVIVATYGVAVAVKRLLEIVVAPLSLPWTMGPGSSRFPS